MWIKIKKIFHSSGLIRQADQWFGRRHQVWYFFGGIAVAWILYISLILPKTDSYYDGIIRQKEDHIIKLNDKIYELRDSVDLYKSYGHYLGTHIISMKDYEFGWYPLIGNSVIINPFTEGLIDLRIDTCPPPPRFPDSSYIYCEPIAQNIKIVEGLIIPIAIKSDFYVISVKGFDSQYIELDLYRAN